MNNTLELIKLCFISKMGLFDWIADCIRDVVTKIVYMLPVKVIRDDKGVPFLYRYHVLTLWKDGPGICVHNFVKSDPGRGYHNHPWNRSFSFILCGFYEERILNPDYRSFKTKMRNRWTFNFLNGDDFHRVMVDEENTPWTIFFHGSRCKTWSMVSLKGEEKPMSTQVSDTDSGWWKEAKLGKSVFEHLELNGNVITTVDIIVTCGLEVLLIRRGKDPFKGHWAFPGGRIDPTDTTAEGAAKRELKEETNIDVVQLKEKLRYQDVVSNRWRDPRGYTTSIVFRLMLCKYPEHIKAGDDAVEFRWFNIYNPPPMAFDHKQILESIL